jgi:hypothetical protein
MRTLLLLLSLTLPSLAVSTPALASWSCSNDSVFFSIQVDSNSDQGQVQIGAFKILGHGRRAIPLPEWLWGPVAVQITPEGTHLKVEGNGFEALLKQSEFSPDNWTALLRAPTSVAGVIFGTQYPYSCTRQGP